MTDTPMTKTLEGEGLRLILDRREVFPSDPGAGTPAMVETRDGRSSGTYWCALDTGELSCGRDVVELTRAQCAWLDRMQETVEAFLDTDTFTPIHA